MHPKIFSRWLPLMLGLGAAIVPLRAAFESVGVEVTEEPGLPASLLQEGLRDGQVVMAVDIGPDGRLTDSLVISASHEELIRPCTEALAHWRFKPARLDGEPVSARVDLVVHLSREGAVVSSVAIETATKFIEQLTGRHFDLMPARPDEIDRPLAAIERPAPHYAAEAESSGVTGRVAVQFYVDEQGRVRLPAVSAAADPYLAAAAVAAIRQWQFAPPTRHGRPVRVAAVQEFTFGRPPP